MGRNDGYSVRRIFQYFVPQLFFAEYHIIFVQSRSFPEPCLAWDTWSPRVHHDESTSPHRLLCPVVWAGEVHIYAWRITTASRSDLLEEPKTLENRKVELCLSSAGCSCIMSNDPAPRALLRRSLGTSTVVHQVLQFSAATDTRSSWVGRGRDSSRPWK